MTNMLRIEGGEGWVPASSESATFSITNEAAQYCVYDGTPPVVIVGHRCGRKLSSVELVGGESLWIKSSRPCFFLSESLIAGRSNNYLKFDGVMSYGELASPITIPPGDDFEIDVDVMTSGVEWSCILYGPQLVIRFTSTNTLNVYGSTFNTSLAYDYQAAGYHTINLKRVGGVTTLSAQGNTVEITGIAPSKELKFYAIGKADPSNPANDMPLGNDEFDGIIANPKVTNLTTGEVLLDCHIDEKGSDVQTNLAVPLGVEQAITHEYWKDYSSWSEGEPVLLEGTDIVFTGEQNPLGWIGIRHGLVTWWDPAGLLYKVVFDLDISEGSVAVNLGSSTTQNSTGYLAESGHYEFVVTGIAGSNVLIQCGNDGAVARVKNLSIRKSSDLTLHNVDPDTDWFENVGGELLGSELWDWGSVDTLGESQVYADYGRILSTDGSFSAIQLTNAVTVGAQYFCSIELFDVVDAGSGLYFDTMEPTVIYTSQGVQENLLNSLNTTVQLKRVGGITDISVKNISCRKYLGDIA